MPAHGYTEHHPESRPFCRQSSPRSITISRRAKPQHLPYTHAQQIGLLTPTTPAVNETTNLSLLHGQSTASTALVTSNQPPIFHSADCPLMPPSQSIQIQWVGILVNSSFSQGDLPKTIQTVFWLSLLMQWYS